MRIFSILIFTTLIYSCTERPKIPESVVEEKSDSAKIVEQFIYGLWSMDSGNTLYNEGFFFRPDGTVDLVGSETTGKWRFNGKDSIVLSFDSYKANTAMNTTNDSFLKIDSITDSRMILSDESGTHLFRKVPFGMNNEGTVIQGFAGELSPGDKKEYSFDLPPAKKVSIKLKADSAILFRVFDQKDELTSLPVREWTSIMIMGGKYKIEVQNSSSKKSGDEGYDLKILVY
jgi:hypothetical protein